MSTPAEAAPAPAKLILDEVTGEMISKQSVSLSTTEGNHRIVTFFQGIQASKGSEGQGGS